MSKARAAAAGVVAIAGAAVLWATGHAALPLTVAIGAGFALVLVHSRWKYDPVDAYEWGWANAALGMAGGGLLASSLGHRAGLGVGLALGSGATLVLLPRLRRPREKREPDPGAPG